MKCKGYSNISLHCEFTFKIKKKRTYPCFIVNIISVQLLYSKVYTAEGILSRQGHSWFDLFHSTAVCSPSHAVAINNLTI